VVNPFVALVAVVGWSLAPVRIAAAQVEEQAPSPQAETAAAGVIKSESNVVLVDVIVTDKKGRYLKDLKQKEFHVFEDGAEQPITSFSREADTPPGAPERQRYMVLFFDDAGMDSAARQSERDAAAKFVKGAASAHLMMAVIEFDGGLHVFQNFTADEGLLMTAVRRTTFAGVPNSGPESVVPWERSPSDLAPGNLLAPLRNIGGTLDTVPGRKTLLFFSNGMGLASRTPSDFQNTVDALNKANVCVYTLSARGLEGADMARGGGDVPTPRAPMTVQQQTQQEYGPTVGTTGPQGALGATAMNSSNLVSLPKLAMQTGGFPIANTNDLASGIEKVSGEMNEYYLLGYVPPSSTHDGRYHKIQVTVDRAGAEVRARNGYADTKSPDLLAGKTEGAALEAKATSIEAGKIPVALRTPYFYVRPGVARVDLALSIPGSAIEYEKQRDNFQSQVNVVGIAYRDDGSVAARFSDKVPLDYAREEKDAAAKAPFDYQTSFRIAAGDYTFKLVLSAGGSEFGKYVTPLVVDPFSGKQLTLSGPAFGDKVIPSLLSSSDIDQKNVEGSVPMVAGGAQLVPSSSDHFKQGAEAVVYVEVYDPILEGSNPQMGILFNILNAKNDQKVYSSNTLPINRFARQGNPLVPVIFKLPTDKLPAGDYTLEIWARDSAQNVSPVQTGNFSVE
jgi:VWFA-related protein